MVYKAPKISKDIAQRLLKLYRDSKSQSHRFHFLNYISNQEPQRLAFIKLLERVCQKFAARTDEEVQQNVLVGMLLFEYLMTRGPNSLTNGSAMHRLLGTILNISAENPIYYKVTFYYLENLYWFAEKSLEENDFSQSTAAWNHKKAFVQSVKSLLSQVHRQELASFSDFVYGLPSLEALIENLEHTIAEYEKIDAQRSYFSKNPARINACQFMRFVLDTCKVMYPYDNKKPTDDVVNNTHYINQWTIIAGAQLYVYKSIADGTWFYNGSQLFSLGMEGINQDNINRLSDLKKCLFFKTLLTHFQNLRINPYFQTVQCRWETINIEKHLKRLNAICAKVEIQKPSSGIPQWLMKESLTWGASLGTAHVLSSYALPIILTLGTEVIPLALAGTPIGLAVVAATATAAVMIPIAIHRGADSLSTYLCKSGVQVASDKIGSNFASFLMKRNSRGAPHDLANNPLLSEDELIEIRQLIKSWLHAPTDIISQDEKNRIYKVLRLHKGYEEEELPKVKIFGRMSIN